MPSIRTEIEIASSPEHVKQVFMDWLNMHQWHQNWFKAIVPQNEKRPSELQKGDKLDIKLAAMGMPNTPVSSNTSERFAWLGGVAYIFLGEHYFEFHPSKTSPGHTTFVQGEDFSGVLSFIMALPFGIATSTPVGFEGFNRDLRRKCEGGE